MLEYVSYICCYIAICILLFAAVDGVFSNHDIIKGQQKIQQEILQLQEKVDWLSSQYAIFAQGIQMARERARGYWFVNSKPRQKEGKEKCID